MMSERSRLEEVKNIGDAGDSIPNGNDPQQISDNAVCEMLRCIKSALQCGDHQSLKILMEKLELWKNDTDEDHTHDYWRVAQLTGETELKNVCILLTITSEKPDNMKWCYLQDVFSVLAMCLCNREIISMMLYHATEIQPVLTLAVVQTYNEDVCFKSLGIINKILIVCGEKYAKFIATPLFLDALVKGVEQWLGTSIRLIFMILQVLKSILICGQENAFNHAAETIQKLSNAISVAKKEILTSTDQDRSCQLARVIAFFEELKESLVLSVDECALYWTKGLSTKELLYQELSQPWLFINCSLPSCGSHNKTPLTFFRKCSACHVVRYCSRQCQRKHWEAGHQIQCKAIINRNKSV